MTDEKKVEEARRAFLGKVGKVAVATPAAMAVLMTAGKDADASPHCYGSGGCR